MANYFLPGYAGQISADSEDRAYDQKSPLYNLYSPRLFGAPPQLTNQCDMRLKSSLGAEPGPVGDWYLDNILRDAQVCNIIVGHARFTGGFNSFASLIRNAVTYATAISRYHIFDNNDREITNQDGAAALLANKEYSMENFETALGHESESKITGMVSTSGNSAIAADAANVANRITGITETATTETVTAETTEGTVEATTSAAQQEVGTDIQTESSIGTVGASDESYVFDVDTIEESKGILNNIGEMFQATGLFGTIGGLKAFIKSSWQMQQAFYTFEADWNSYINNVRMMINTAVMMLGVNDGKVRIGDNLLPLSSAVKLSETDVWANYRFITPTENNRVGDVNAINTLSGDFNQYVSFMTEPVQIQESFSNGTTTSQIYANVISSGEGIGNEIAFITNSSRNAIDDAVVSLAGSAINIAERVMQSLTLGTGKFTAAILGSMARSYTGDHTIFPEVFSNHSTTSSVGLTIKLRASAGDPYTYLMEVLVPMFHLIAMAVPQMSKNAASAYSYPPLVQVHIPGVWGTRLGIIETLSISKSGNDYSVNGYPLAVDIAVNIKDLQHVMMSSGMDKPAQMLNNDTMFDYIAQCAGVDKYRFNPSIRIVTKIALAASAGSNFFHNLGHAILNDASSIANKITGIGT